LALICVPVEWGALPGSRSFTSMQTHYASKAAA
jgi:hypothetical protein